MIYRNGETAANGLAARDVTVCDPRGRPIQHVVAADTDAGWMEIVVTDRDQRVIDQKKRALVRVRIHRDFDVVDTRTGPLHRVRWNSARLSAQDFPIAPSADHVTERTP